MMTTPKLRVEMLSTGDEVLHGQIVDTNAAWLADYFFQQGLALTSRTTVGDDLNLLVETLQQRSQYADILIVNGGLGPTSDDLSAQAAALAADQPLTERPEWIARMESWFAQRGRVMAPSNRKQALLPISAELIDNPVGTACGFMLQLNQCLIYFTPGVPYEFKVMIETQIVPMLRNRFVLPPAMCCLRLTTFGRTESQLAELLDSMAIAKDIIVGYRSAMPIIELKLTSSQHNYQKMLVIWQNIKQQLADNILYEGTQGLAQLISERLIQRRIKVALCEHLTAGAINLALNSANAPIAGDECLPNRESMSLSELATLARKTATRYHSELAIVTGNWSEQRFSVALFTPQGVSAWHVDMLGNTPGLATQQDIVMTFALHQLLRWLDGKQGDGDYEWLKIVERYNA